MDRFNKDGRMMIPLTMRKKELGVKEEDVRYVVDKAYCPNGCNLIDSANLINGYPGIRLKFERTDCSGELVISAIEGDFDKKVLSGNLIQGTKDELLCPHCGIMFAKLVNCGCSTGADMIALGLTPKLNFNNAISFCNVTGCSNGTFVASGDVIRHVRLQNLR